ncbi:MAG: AAA family ATPase [Anaerolineales bacterium]
MTNVPSSFSPPDGMTLEDFNATATRLLAEVSKVLVGQEALVRQMLITLLAGGNALLEGVPGLGKTLLVRTLAQVVSGTFSRIQFTPDLMPADIVGTMVLTEDEAGRRAFRFEPGPVFANLLLADEINRATPRTQSALLEAMQEQCVTVGRATHNLPNPFFVLATQNPLEMEGTYPLPEAQLDRFFFKINVAFPTEDELIEIARRTTGAETPVPSPVVNGPTVLAMQRLARQVPVAEHVTRYAARLVLATHPENGRAAPLARKHLRYGASPRGLQALILAAKIAALLDSRAAASIEDIQASALPALRHRVILNFEAQAEGVNPDEVLAEVIEGVTLK